MKITITGTHQNPITAGILAALQRGDMSFETALQRLNEREALDFSRSFCGGRKLDHIRIGEATMQIAW